MNYKTFDQSAYDDNDGPAKAILFAFLNAYGNHVEIAEEDYGLDLRGLTEEEPDHECYISKQWLDGKNYPWKEVLVLDRKSHYTLNQKPCFYWQISADGRSAWCIPGEAIKNAPIIYRDNKKVKEEPFRLIPMDKCIRYSLFRSPNGVWSSDPPTMTDEEVLVKQLKEREDFIYFMSMKKERTDGQGSI